MYGEHPRETEAKAQKIREQSQTKTTALVVILTHPRICRLVNRATAWTSGNLICSSCSSLCLLLQRSRSEEDAPVDVCLNVVKSNLYCQTCVSSGIYECVSTPSPPDVNLQLSFGTISSFHLMYKLARWASMARFIWMLTFLPRSRKPWE